MSTLQLQQLENTWQHEIKKGNGFFRSSAYTKASSHYLQAIIASEMLMENIKKGWEHFLRIPGMYYTACINLAYNYWSMQDIKNAGDYFLYCTYKLKLLAERQSDDLLLKQAAALYWQKAVERHTEFAEKTGAPIPADLSSDETYVQLQN